MLNITKIICDMIAGILAGFQILVPQKTYEDIDKGLLGQLKDTVTEKGALRWLWIIFVIIIVIAISLIIEIPAFNTDIKTGILKTHILSTIFLVSGFLAGMIVLVIISRIKRTNGFFSNLSPTKTVPIYGFILTYPQ